MTSEVTSVQLADEKTGRSDFGVSSLLPTISV